MMTTIELAEYLRLHVTTIRKYAAQGEIPAMRIARVWRFDKDAIDEWIRGDQNKIGGHGAAQRASNFTKPRK